MCGDSTNRADVMKLVSGENIDLVLTDPPYGIKIGGRGRLYPRVIGDMNSDMFINIFS